MSFRFSAALIIFFMSTVCKAQFDSDLLIEQIVEYIAENASEDYDYSEITERLHFYRKHPLNINKVVREQMEELVFISALQINNLIAHREKNGLFQDVLELQSVEGFDDLTTQWLINFVSVDPPDLLSDISLHKVIRKSDHDLMIRLGKVLEKQEGFDKNDSGKTVYAGSAARIFIRYRFDYANKISASVNMEKDPGESFFQQSGKGFDFYSANICLTGSRLVKKFIVGDYALQFGQGLTMWSGLGFGKGAGIATVAKQAIGLRPYSSVNESSFLRGLSATLSIRGIVITPFVSYKKLDATLTGKGDELSALVVSGLHRTNAELENKNRVSQLVFGLNSQYVGYQLKAGFTIYRTSLDMPIAKSDLLYERYDFKGQSLVNLGIYYSYSFRNTYFFGEAAQSMSSGAAFLNGFMASLSSQVSVVVLHRNYTRNYHSFFNQGLSESSEAVNEKGFYTGLTIKFNNRFELTSYFDLYRFPWLKFRVDAPSNGHELLAQLTYSLSKKFKVAARFKHEQKEENTGEVNVAGGLDEADKQNCRIELTYKLNNNFSLRNRVEVSAYKKGLSAKEFGFLSYQDIIYNPLSSRFSGNVRFAIFDTPGFNSRIYAYENDVLYGYSVPSYQGSGLRCYVNGRYTIRRGMDIWLRYALLAYAAQETVGSGHDMVAGSQRSDIKLQLRFQF